MRLSKRALEMINTVSTRLDLAIALKVSEQTIIRYISTNDDKLTKAASLIIIKRSTGLKDDEILENEMEITH